MKDAPLCPRCGARLPTTALGGLCPRCIGRGLLGAEPAVQVPVRGDEAEPFVTERSEAKPEERKLGREAVKDLKLDLADFSGDVIGQRIGRYKILERVGEGGCGVVYVAEQTEPVRRRVALKVIKLGMDTKQVVARFEAELQALAMMDHANIAKVLDAGATDLGRPYFVMELVRGIKITEYCDQARLSTKDRLSLFIKVCQAIQHAHQKGIIHRDIKPSNILVTLHDGIPVPKVIDFGIAKATEGRLTENTIYTQLHQIIGTPAYMSPEQAEMSGLDIDTRSDIYSLGVLLYELLAGSTPFDGKELISQSLDAMRKTIREKEPPRPSKRLTTLQGDELTTTAERRSTDASRLLHQLRGDLDWIVMKCLEKDRSRRYETANGLVSDLKRHLSDQPVVARPPSRLYEFQKTVQRHKFGFAAAAVLMLTLAAGAVLSGWQARVATRAKDQAIHAEAQKAEEARIAQAARQQAEAQRARVEELLRQSKIVESGLTLARALELAETGDVDYGMTWMIEAMKRAPVGQPEFQEMVRRNLSGWSQLVPQLLQPWFSIYARHSFSSDGAVLAVALGDTLHITDTRSGADLVEPLTWPGRTVNILAFNPSGRQLAVALRPRENKAEEGPGAITVLDARTGRPLFPPVSQESSVAQLLFSRDGSIIFSIGFTGRQITAWEATTGRKLRAVEDRSAKWMNFLLSPDGTLLVARDQSVVVDAGTLEPVAADPQNPDTLYNYFRPDGARLTARRSPATSGEDVELRLPPAYDAPNPEIKLGHWPNDLALAPDGSLINVFRSLIDLETLRPIGSPLRYYYGDFDIDVTMNIVPMQSGRWQLPRPLSRPAAPVRLTNPKEPELGLYRSGSGAVEYSAGGKTFVHREDFYNGRPMTAARLREAGTGFPLGRPLRQRGNASWDVALSRDGRLAATTVYTSLDDWQLFSGETTLWNARTGERLHGPLVPNLMIRALEFSPDGKLLVGSSRMDPNDPSQWRIYFWNTETGEPDGQDIVTQYDAAVELVFSPDGKTLAAGMQPGRDSTGFARLYDVRTRKPLGDSFPAGTSSEWCVYLAFTPDGQSLLTGGWTTGIDVTDLRTMRPRFAPIRSAEAPSDVKISSDGSRFAIADKSGTLRVFDLMSGRQIGRRMQHTVGSQAIALNDNGTLLVSGSMEGTVRLWDVPTSQPLGPPLAHRYAIWDVRFLSDGRSFSSTDRRGITKHWPVPEPARGEPAALQAQLEMWTRTKLTDGVPTQLTDEECLQHKTLLDRSAPGSVWFSDPVPQLIWHEARASDAEGDGNLYGAWWHLNRLVAARPDDWQLRARSGRIQVLRGELAAAEVDFAKAAELNGQKPLLDWFAQCAYTCREQGTWKSALYFLERLVAAEPEEWQWRADQEEAFDRLGRKNEARAAFVKALELCKQPIIPALAADLARRSDWAALQKELSHGEKTGWLSLADWQLWARSARELGNHTALTAILARFAERAGPDCPLVRQLSL